MKNLKSEDGFLKREGQWKGESFVPNGAGGAGVVGFGGESAVGIYPEDCVRLEVADLPVYVL